WGEGSSSISYPANSNPRSCLDILAPNPKFFDRPDNPGAKVPVSPTPASPNSLDITAANFDTDLLQASITQPVLVHFWTPRSESSVTLGGVLGRLVDEYQGNLRLARSEVDSQAQIAAMFGIRSVPTVILVRE